MLLDWLKLRLLPGWLELWRWCGGDDRSFAFSPPDFGILDNAIGLVVEERILFCEDVGIQAATDICEGNKVWYLRRR